MSFKTRMEDPVRHANHRLRSTEYSSGADNQTTQLTTCFVVVFADVSCQRVAQVSSSTVEHMYDIWVSDDHELLVYSDWRNRSINMLSLTTGTLLNPLATGLMRPSQFVFVGTHTSSACRHYITLHYINAGP